MQPTTQISFGERNFRIGILVWIAAGVTAYLVLPWFALEYGLFDATVDEYIHSLGLSLIHISEPTRQ